MFQKVLIANRGEIAVRIIQACRDLGIISVAVYSEADREALHAQIADEAVCIGPAHAADSYLNMDNIISAALASGCQAIHPGFGFLSENPDFAERITQAGLAFIGPTAATIRLMDDKSEAKRNAIAAGVPVALGTDGPLRDFDEAISEAERIGYPVMLKAASGGGGKGIRVAESVKDLKDAYDSAVLQLSPTSVTAACTWKNIFTIRAISRCRFWVITTATWCTCSSVSARCSAATRS